MKIKKYTKGELFTNGYIVYNEEKGECFCIDVGFDEEEYIDFIKERNLKIKGILLTHHHYDHSTASYSLAKKLDTQIFIHEDDYDMLKKLYKDMDRVKTFNESDIFKLDDDIFEVIQTKGHTKGGVFFTNRKEKVIFTGDTLFKEEIGLTSLEDGSPDEMAETCRNIIEKLEDDFTIYPGHGDSGLLGYVKRDNEEYKQALLY